VYRTAYKMWYRPPVESERVVEPVDWIIHALTPSGTISSPDRRPLPIHDRACR
jgi:hypothetical protein